MAIADRVEAPPEEAGGLPDRLRRAIRTRTGLQLSGLLGPGAFWLIVFFLVPLAVVFAHSFATRGPYGTIRWTLTLANYRQFADWLYIKVFLFSLLIAVLTTVICLLVGYPFAYVMSRAPRRWRNALLILVMVPFWTNFLVRTYAIMLLLRSEGLVNSFLRSIGLIDQPLNLLYTPGAVVLGLVYGYLPFMILPLYASIEKFDFSLVEAAQDLGASARRVFLRVMLPLTMPGVVAGSILVFIPSVGAFVTPDLLGGGKVVMIGNLIQQQFLTARHWPFGSAISFVLMAIVLASTLAYFRSGGERAV